MYYYTRDSTSERQRWQPQSTIPSFLAGPQEGLNIRGCHHQCTVFQKAYILSGSGFHKFLYSIIESLKKLVKLLGFFLISCVFTKKLQLIFVILKSVYWFYHVTSLANFFCCMFIDIRLTWKVEQLLLKHAQNNVFLHFLIASFV